MRDTYELNGKVYDAVGDESPGGGAAGIIRIFEERRTKIKYAFKFYQLDQKNDVLPLARNEIRVLKELNEIRSHPNIVRFIASIEVGEYLLVTDLGTYNLYKYVDKLIGEKKYSMEKIRDIFLQVARGVIFLHINDYAHRDLNPGNIVVFHDAENDVMKLCDFGTACKLDSNGKVSKFCDGTPNFKPPEHAKNNYNGKKFDVRQLAFILRYLFDKMNVLEKDYPEIYNAMTSDDPDKRPEVFEIINDE